MFNLLRLITHCNVNRNYREEANRGRGLQRSAAACRGLDLNVCEARLMKMHMILPFFFLSDPILLKFHLHFNIHNRSGCHFVVLLKYPYNILACCLPLVQKAAAKCPPLKIKCNVLSSGTLLSAFGHQQPAAHHKEYSNLSL